MNFDVRYANHPEDSKRYDTQELRRHYHIRRVFTADEINLTYSHQDRIIAGGVMPVKEPLALGTCKELAAPYFLARREMGVTTPPRDNQRRAGPYPQRQGRHLHRHGGQRTGVPVPGQREPGEILLKFLSRPPHLPYGADPHGQGPL